MSARPSTYYLEWDAATGPDVEQPELRSEDIPRSGVRESLKAARDRADDISREFGVTVIVMRRVNVEDVTPAGDPPGLIWDWESDFVEDRTAAGPFHRLLGYFREDGSQGAAWSAGVIARCSCDWQGKTYTTGGKAGAAWRKHRDRARQAVAT